MRLEKNSFASFRVASVLMVVTFAAIYFFSAPLVGQVQTTGQSAATAQQQPVPNANQPYLLSSRLHLQMGTNKGYLVVRVDLADGSYVYSLTQKGDARPTKLTVTPSTKFRLLGAFAPDRAAEVAADDTSKAPLEKHRSMIQFFAPIEVAPGTDVSSLTAEVVLDGQVCTAENFCMPIMGEKVAGKFAGYFQGKSEGQGSAPAARSARADATGAAPNQLQR